MELEKIIKEKVEGIDVHEIAKEIMWELLETAFHREVRDQIPKIIKAKVQELADTRIEILFDEQMKKGVSMDDGWGKQVTHETFGNLVRETFERKLKSDYQLNKIIDRIVEQRVSAALGNARDEIAKKMAEELIKKIK